MSKPIEVPYGEHYSQKYYVYLPENPFSDNLDLLVYWHGGQWQYGHPKYSSAFRNANTARDLAGLSEENTIIVTMGYRLAGEIEEHHEEYKHRVPSITQEEMATDGTAGLLNVFALMETHSFTPRTITLGGYSAGSWMAGCVMSNTISLDALGAYADRISKLVLLGMVADQQTYLDITSGPYQWTGELSALRDWYMSWVGGVLPVATNLIDLVGNLPTTLEVRILQGARDDLTLYNDAVTYKNAVSARGITASLTTLSISGHYLWEKLLEVKTIQAIQAIIPALGRSQIDKWIVPARDLIAAGLDPVQWVADNEIIERQGGVSNADFASVVWKNITGSDTLTDAGRLVIYDSLQSGTSRRDALYNAGVSWETFRAAEDRDIYLFELLHDIDEVSKVIIKMLKTRWQS
jgi:acetyl esterase/lipase